MQIRVRYLVSALVVLLFLGAAALPVGDGADKEAVLIQVIVQGLGRWHYDPKIIDDDFSEQSFDYYLDQVDGGRRFLTQEDVAKLRPYRDQLDDETGAGTYEFFNEVQEVLKTRLEITQGMYRTILAKPFDFTQEEKLELMDEESAFYPGDAELREYWRRYLKYETLQRYSDKLADRTEAAAAEDPDEEAGELLGKTDEQLEADARGEVLDMFDKWYERLARLTRQDRMSQYLNALISTYDPHTSYFQPKDKENFDIRFSGQLEGIGATLSLDGDYTKVNDIVVGGPAWKGKKLKESDLILKVRQEKEDAVSIKGLPLDEVVSQIRGPKGTKVWLTVKKADGNEEEIMIVRDVVILEESFAKSLILPGAAKDEKIGYLYLPSFYANFQDRNGRFSAPDVEKELAKLKAENVDGIILDLRSNGGGSLADVVKMTGYFFEQGPVVQVKTRTLAPEVLKDEDPSVQYDGPLIVMVNEYSASASEILAAALQDYDRALIVGSTTFGKGTVQRFIDLDRTVSDLQEIKPLGSIKLTMQKFYRVDGGSTQLRGVTPDIVLPDNFSYIETGEKEQDFPLPWTEIAPVAHQQSVYRIDRRDELRRRSEARVAASPAFQRINQNALRVKEQREDRTRPLMLDEFRAQEDARKVEAKTYENLFEDVVNPGVFNITVDLQSIHADESKGERNDSFIESVGKDVYIREVVNIMHDMLEIE